MPVRIALAIACLVAVAAAPSAHAKQFTVAFHGSGQYLSDYSTTTSRDYTGADGSSYSGSCTDYRHEQLDFEWSVPFKVSLAIGQKGVKGASDTGKPVAPGHPREDEIINDTRPGADGDGCVHAGDSGTDAGKSDCVGHAIPAGVEKLKVTSAKSGGRTLLTVSGPVFTGQDFSGNWAYQSGSCSQNADGQPLGLPDGLTFPQVVSATFPVRAARWDTLPKGRYFRVKIAPGHYAPHGLLPIRCDGCTRKLDWSGEVRVRRVK